MGLKKAGHGNMKNIRIRMLKNYGSICMNCGYDGYVEVHHVKSVIDGGLDNLENLLLLCEKCHADAHGQVKKNYLDQLRSVWNGR